MSESSAYLKARLTKKIIKMDGKPGMDKIFLYSGVGAFVGAASGTVRSVWSIPKLGKQLPSFSAQMKTIGARSAILASVGGVYATGEYIAASMRNRDDHINAIYGGFAAGIVPAMLRQSPAVGVGAGAACAAAMGAAKYWNSNQPSSQMKWSFFHQK